MRSNIRRHVAADITHLQKLNEATDLWTSPVVNCWNRWVSPLLGL